MAIDSLIIAQTHSSVKEVYQFVHFSNIFTFSNIFPFCYGDNVKTPFYIDKESFYTMKPIVRYQNNNNKNLLNIYVFI